LPKAFFFGGGGGGGRGQIDVKEPFPLVLFSPVKKVRFYFLFATAAMAVIHIEAENKTK
jgi:hypothetical protein